MTNLTDLMQVTVPEGTKGNVSIARFDISEEDVRRTTLFSRDGRGYTPPGEYTRLLIDGQLWMSDTLDERRDHISAVHRAARAKDTTGPLSVLITGLGIGMVVNAMLQLPRVGLVEVVELNQDVIDLVGPHYQQLADEQGVRLNIHQGDAMDRKAIFGSGHRQWDIVWHDIWLGIGGDNYEDMKSLRRRYGSYAKWQGCWCGDQVKRLYFENKREAQRHRDRYRDRGWI